MKFVSKTDVGKKRKNNEDSIFSKIYNKDVALFIVADGLGGYESGEVASSMLTKKVSSFIEERLESITNCKENAIQDTICMALTLANGEIYRLEKTDIKYKGMGTTVVLLLKVKNKFYYVSIGDSRMYYINKNKKEIEQITIDDTYVNELVKTKVINEKEAKVHPQRHVLTKAIGIVKDLKFVAEKLNKKDGIVILCSDGLTNMVSSDKILECVQDNEFDKLADNLVNLANNNGGLDNVSVTVIEL